MNLKFAIKLPPTPHNHKPVMGYYQQRQNHAPSLNILHKHGPHEPQVHWHLCTNEFIGDDTCCANK